MRINHFTYHDRLLNWKLETVHFNDLTLLVGASGVGKTLILRSLLNLKRIAKGKSLNGVSWKVDFTESSNYRYKWEGEFEKVGLEQDFFESDSFEIENEEQQKRKAKILSEKLYLNDRLIIKRSNNKIVFNDKITPKLSSQESIVNILKEEDDINPAYRGFKKILFSDQSESTKTPSVLNFFDAEKLVEKYKNLKQIRESDEDIFQKLYLSYRNAPETFNKIKERFIEVFPYVEDIKLEPLETEEDLPFLLGMKLPVLKIKEKGVNNWISQEKISSGMYRVLIQMSELYLCAEGTLILIDEFENSLGVNCIDELTDDIIGAQRDLQFILTSHHPYIINTIGYKHWKLVTRKAGVVKTQGADEFKLGKSKHEAFLQLLNLEEYKSGVSVK